VKDLIPGRDTADGRDDVRIRGAPTNVAAHPLADLLTAQRDPPGRHVRGDVAGPPIRHFREHADRGADLTGGAVAALEAVVLDESRLQGVKGAGLAQTFDRHDLVVLMHDGEGQAGVDAPAVDQHRASAALPVVAPFLGPGQAQMFAQRVQQRGPRIHLETRHLIINAQRDGQESEGLVLAPPGFGCCTADQAG